MKKFLKVLLIIVLVVLVIYFANSIYKYNILKKSFNTVFDLVETENFKVAVNDKMIYSMGEEKFLEDTINDEYYIIKQDEKYYCVNNIEKKYNEYSNPLLEKSGTYVQKLKLLVLIEMFNKGIGEPDSVEKTYNKEILKYTFNPKKQIIKDGNYSCFYFDYELVKINNENFKIVKVGDRNIEYYEFNDEEIFENASLENLDGYTLVKSESNKEV